MSDQTIKMPMTQKNTTFAGITIKRLPVKEYFMVLRLWKAIKTIDQRLISLTDCYNNGQISKEKFLKAFREISKYTLEFYKDFLTTSLKCKDKIIDRITGIIEVNRNKALKAHLKGLPIIKRSELKNLGLKVYQRLRVLKKAVCMDDRFDNLIVEILSFNFPELFNSTGEKEKSQPLNKNNDQYLEIVTALSRRLSQTEIDKLYIDEALYLIKSINRDTIREYFSTHFQGVRYSILAQSSYKNDNSGEKRAKDMEKIVCQFIDVICDRQIHPKKSSFIQDMENEAIQIMNQKKVIE